MRYLFLLVPTLCAAQSLQVYAIDTEGGKSTLYVSPSGQAMLVDTGYAGFNNRDASRIAAAAADAGVKRIDYLLITHYHADHMGGVPQLVAKMPVGTFIDHGPNFETVKDTKAVLEAYEAERAKHPHIVVKAGDIVPINLKTAVDRQPSPKNRGARTPACSVHTRVNASSASPVWWAATFRTISWCQIGWPIYSPPTAVSRIKGIQVQVVTAAGVAIAKPLPGAGQANPLCSSYRALEPDTGENAHSIGFILTYGKFRLSDLGDLYWNQEHDLACPANKAGTVDVYMTIHHGKKTSSSPQMVDALHPKVAIMNNGPTSGCSTLAWQTIHDSPGLIDIWQLHLATANPPDHNSRENLIANTETEDRKGAWIKLTAHQDGSFTVLNGRNGYEKSYQSSERPNQ